MTAVVSSVTVICIFLVLPIIFRFILRSQELELEMKRRLIELDAANESAKLANLNKGEFISFLCHELRNPLHIACSNVDFLLETKLHSEQRCYVRSILDSAQLMSQLVNDVLDLDKLDKRKMTFECIAMDLHYLCHSLIQNFLPQANAKGLHLMIDFDSGVPKYVHSDPTRIHQLLLNLISNAIKFTQQGKVRLRVRLGDNIKPETQSNRDEIQSVNDGDEARSSHSTDSLLDDHSVYRNYQTSITNSKSISMPELVSIDVDRDATANGIEKAHEDLHGPIESVDSNEDSPCACAGRIRKCIVFEVEDDGIGITKEEMDRLFQPYVQAKLSTVRKFGGSGLGKSHKQSKQHNIQKTHTSQHKRIDKHWSCRGSSNWTNRIQRRTRT